MKCDELKAEQWLDYSGEPMPCYPKAKVDAAIAELKQKLMPCLNGDCILTCEVVEKYGKENAELKQKLHDAEMQADLAECAVTEYKIDCDKLKSEADKVIADLEESHKKVVEQLLIEIVKLKEGAKNLILDNYLKDKEIRHQKYKRCLGLATICRHEWCTMYYERKNYSENKFLDHLMSKKNRHKEKWLELAEKFKDKEA